MDEETKDLLQQLKYYSGLINQHKEEVTKKNVEDNKDSIEKELPTLEIDSGVLSVKKSKHVEPLNGEVYVKKNKYKLEKKSPNTSQHANPKNSESHSKDIYKHGKSSTVPYSNPQSDRLLSEKNRLLSEKNTQQVSCYKHDNSMPSVAVSLAISTSKQCISADKNFSINKDGDVKLSKSLTTASTSMTVSTNPYKFVNKSYNSTKQHYASAVAQRVTVPTKNRLTATTKFVLNTTEDAQHIIRNTGNKYKYVKKVDKSQRPDFHNLGVKGNTKPPEVSVVPYELKQEEQLTKSNKILSTTPTLSSMSPDEKHKKVNDVKTLLHKVDSIKTGFQSKIPETKKANCSNVEDNMHGPLYDIQRELNKINLIQSSLKPGYNTQESNNSNLSETVQNISKYKLVKHSSLPSFSKQECSKQLITSKKSDLFHKTNTTNTTSVFKQKYKIVKSQTFPNASQNSVLKKKGPYKLVKRRVSEKGTVPHYSPTNNTPEQNEISMKNRRSISFDKKNGRPVSHCVVTRHKLIKKNIFQKTKRSNSPIIAAAKRNSILYKSRYRLVKQAGHTVRVKRKKKGHNSKYSIVKSSSQDAETDFDINKALGRQVENISSNKYKFIKPKSSRQPKSKGKLQKQSKFKLDRREKTKTHSSSKQHKYVVLRGQLYRKAKTGLVIMGHTKKYADLWTTPPRRHPVRRLSECSKDKTSTQLAARQALVKSIVVQHRYKKDQRMNYTPTKSKKYCLYYNRFGKCSRGQSCPFVHDPQKVAVCTRFLRGTCQVDNCPFSHKVSKEKMPVCKFFLNGQCQKEDCPYLHVNVGEDADICEDFVLGYCGAGDKCKKKHILQCPEFEKEGKCSKGSACKMQHIKKAKKRKSTNRSLLRYIQPKLAKGNTQESDNIEGIEAPDDISLPMKDRHLPAFISIDSGSVKIPQYMQQSRSGELASFQIRPNLQELNMTGVTTADEKIQD